MKKAPFEGKWAVPGGMILLNESADDSAKRQLESKAGITSAHIEQLATFGEVDRDPLGRVVSVAYLGLVRNIPKSLSTTNEYANVRWVKVNELPPLAYDHKHIIETALERLRGKLAYTNIAQFLLPQAFTLYELQLLYEALTNRTLDKRNFRKKYLASGLIKSTNKLRRGSHRPATLYTFKNKAIKTLTLFA